MLSQTQLTVLRTKLETELNGMASLTVDQVDDHRGDEADMAVSFHNRSVAIALSEHQVRRRTQIIAALRRMKEGTYDGVCGLCEEDISIKRLEAIPSTQTCINCANLAESNGVKQVQNRADFDDPTADTEQKVQIFQRGTTRRTFRAGAEAQA